MVAEKQHIDYQVSGFDDGEDGEDEGVNSLETNDDGELSFDYRPSKQGLDAVSTSRNSMEVNFLIRDLLHLFSLSQHKPMSKNVNSVFAKLFTLASYVGWHQFVLSITLLYNVETWSILSIVYQGTVR